MIYLAFLSLTVLHVALQIFDIMSTLDALHLGGRERFWISRFFLRFGHTVFVIYKSAGTSLIVIGFALLMPHQPVWSLAGLVAVNAFYGWILAGNYRVIQRLKLGRYR